MGRVFIVGLYKEEININVKCQKRDKGGRVVKLVSKKKKNVTRKVQVMKVKQLLPLQRALNYI